MLYVITAVHNRYKITELFVDQLRCQTYQAFRLILVDDGSTDGTAEMVRGKMPSAVILHGDGNLWWGGALHLAYRYVEKNLSDDDIVFIANDDTMFGEDYLEKAVEILRRNPHTILTGYGISKQTGKQVDGAVDYDFIHGSMGCVQDGKIKYGNCSSTRSVFLTAGDFKRIGGFHPILLPHYASDYEWSIRAARKEKMRILCDSDLKYYVNEATTGDHAKKNRTLKQIMSKRSVSNPIYKTTFCLLASPWGKKMPSLFNQILRFIRK